MIAADLKQLAAKMEDLATGDLDLDNLRLSPECSPVDVLDIFTSVRYLSDQWGHDVGVRVECGTDHGSYVVDTDARLLIAGEVRIPLSEAVCVQLNESFDELRGI